MEVIVHWLDSLFASLGISEKFMHETDRFLAVLLALLLSFLVTWIVNRWVVPLLNRFVEHTTSKWDDLLLNTKVLRSLTRLLPPFILYFTVPYLSVTGTIPRWVDIGCQIYLTIAFMLLANALINAFYDVWNTLEHLRDKPVMGVLQVVKLLIYIATGIIIISIVFDRSPVAMLTGLGASAAILSLVFKDTLVGLASGIQLSVHDMLRKGDWITVQKHNINGIVEEITLNTVKVRNFDATTFTIPPYLLVSEPFQNWRSMKEGGARRIARSILIDIQSVHLLTDEEIYALPAFSLIAHLPELKDRKLLPTDSSGKVVNLTLLRVYLKHYIREYSLTNTELIFIVRELQHTPQGIPLELIFFVDETEWERYESVQSNIMDYVTAVIPQFALRVFQQPSAHDVEMLGTSLNGSHNI